MVQLTIKLIQSCFIFNYIIQFVFQLIIVSLTSRDWGPFMHYEEAAATYFNYSPLWAITELLISDGQNDSFHRIGSFKLIHLTVNVSTILNLSSFDTFCKIWWQFFRDTLLWNMHVRQLVLPALQNLSLMLYQSSCIKFTLIKIQY